jgi:hypothetical protein
MLEFDVAQICTNGHLITASSKEEPELMRNFCKRCGSQTITTCQHCNSEITGYETEYGALLGYDVPHYCPDCGKPYPWTEKSINTITLLIKEEANFSTEEAANLTNSLPDIVTETPATQLAVLRFKKAVCSAGKFTADSLRQFTIDFGCELAKKSLGL